MINKVPESASNSARPVRHVSLQAIQFLYTVSVYLICFVSDYLANLIYWQLVTNASPKFMDVFSESTVIFVFLIVPLISMGGLKQTKLINPSEQIRIIAISWFVTFFILGWFLFLMKITANFSRGSTSILFVIGLLILELFAFNLAFHLRSRFKAGRLDLIRAILIRINATEISDIEREAQQAGISIVLNHNIRSGPGADDAHTQICEFLDHHRAKMVPDEVDILIFDLDWSSIESMKKLRDSHFPLSLPVYIIPDGTIRDVFKYDTIEIGGIKAINFERAPLSGIDLYLKRGLDIVVATLSLVILSPVMLVTAMAIALESGLPIFFRQRRRGLGAREFYILKFRSMHVMEDGGSIKQVTKNDHRVTRIGKFIRKTSIDELPQIFNVLRGDMSIVGPRPHALAHDNSYSETVALYSIRHNVKPGITGWAQAHGFRGETATHDAMQRRIDYDIWYLNNWSLWLDISIILKTVWQLIINKDVY